MSFIITYNGIDISFRTTIEENLSELGQFLVQKLKPFSEDYDEGDILKFILDMAKLFNTSYDVISEYHEYLYTIDFDRKHPDFIVEHKQKKSEFKFYIEDIPEDWIQEITEWVNADEDESSDSESDSESDQE